MTAQFVAMNRRGVVVATDSAVSLSGKQGTKVLRGAQKLFQLVDGCNIGLLVCGSGEIGGIPWGVVADEFAIANAGRRFKTVAAAADALVSFTETAETLFPEAHAHRHLQDDVLRCLQMDATRFWEAIGREAINPRTASFDPTEEFRDTFWPALGRTDSGAPVFDGFESGELLATIENAVADSLDGLSRHFTASCATDGLLIDVVLSGFERLTDSQRDTAVTAIASRLVRVDEAVTSGVVLAGFGADQTFPSLVELTMAGPLLGRSRFVRQEHEIAGTMPGFVLPLASSLASEALLTGLEPGQRAAVLALQNAVAETVAARSADAVVSTPGIPEVAAEALKAQFAALAAEGMAAFAAAVRRLCSERYAEVARLAAHMGAGDLIRLAEHMIAIEAERVWLSNDAEGVGGPVSIAYIGRREGFRWVRTAHGEDIA